MLVRYNAQFFYHNSHSNPPLITAELRHFLV